MLLFGRKKGSDMCVCMHCMDEIDKNQFVYNEEYDSKTPSNIYELDLYIFDVLFSNKIR